MVTAIGPPGPRTYAAARQTTSPPGIPLPPISPAERPGLRSRALFTFGRFGGTAQTFRAAVATVDESDFATR